MSRASFLLFLAMLAVSAVAHPPLTAPAGSPAATHRPTMHAHAPAPAPMRPTIPIPSPSPLPAISIPPAHPVSAPPSPPSPIISLPPRDHKSPPAPPTSTAAPKAETPGIASPPGPADSSSGAGHVTLSRVVVAGAGILAVIVALS